MFEEFNTKDLESKKELLEIKLKKAKDEIEKLLQIENKSYENFVMPYQEIGESINIFLTPIFHIDSVKNSEITTKVHEDCLPIISIYETELSQNVNIYRALKDIQDKSKSTLNDIQKKVLENEIRDFELSGCHLNNNLKERLKELNLKLSELSHKFSQNILNATNSYEMIIEDYEDVKEIPKSDLELATFEEEGKTKYKFTLQMPSYIAYITYGTNRERREEIYKAYCTRAPENGEIIEEILLLKDEKSKILGFDSYSQYSLSTKMAKSDDDVIEFLYELAKKGKDGAINEYNEIKEFAKKDGLTNLKSFDLSYYSEKLKKEKYDLDEEFYRPYFEKESVLKGFFEFLNLIFNIEFKKANTPTWDEKAQAYDIYENGKISSRIYIDLESRKDKRGKVTQRGNKRTLISAI